MKSRKRVSGSGPRRGSGSILVSVSQRGSERRRGSGRCAGRRMKKTIRKRISRRSRKMSRTMNWKNTMKRWRCGKCIR